MNKMSKLEGQQYILNFSNSQMPFIDQIWEPFWSTKKLKIKISKDKQKFVDHYNFYIHQMENTNILLVIKSIEDLFKDIYSKDIKDYV